MSIVYADAITMTNQYKNKSIAVHFIGPLQSIALVAIFCEKSIYFKRQINHTFSSKNANFPLKTIFSVIPNFLTNQYKTLYATKIVYKVHNNRALGHKGV